MDCSCSISVDSGDLPEFSKCKFVKAKKFHKCCECCRDILPGEYYEYVFGVWDGEKNEYKTCNDCMDVRNVFFDDWTFTTLWDDFYDNFSHDDIPEKCIAGLTKPARDKICDWIEECWDEDEEE